MPYPIATIGKYEIYLDGDTSEPKWTTYEGYKSYYPAWGKYMLVPVGEGERVKYCQPHDQIVHDAYDPTQCIDGELHEDECSIGWKRLIADDGQGR